MKIGIYNILLLQLIQAGKAQDTDYENSYNGELKTSENNDYSDKFQESYNQINQQPFVNNELALHDHNKPTIDINSNSIYYYTGQFNELFKKFNFGFFTEDFKWDLSSYWPSMPTKYNKLDALKCLDELEAKSNKSIADTIIIVDDKCTGAFSINLESGCYQKGEKWYFDRIKKSILEANRRTHIMAIHSGDPVSAFKLQVGVAVSCAWNHEYVIRKKVKEWTKDDLNSKK